MQVARTTEITIDTTVDLKVAEKIVSRIRAAMQNNIETIVIRFEQDPLIHSAEFLAFLATCYEYQKEHNGKLIVQGIHGKNAALFEISKLDHLLER